MKATIERIEKTDNPQTAPVITGYTDVFNLVRGTKDEISCAFDDYRIWMEEEGAEDWSLRMTVETPNGIEYYYSTAE